MEIFDMINIISVEDDIISRKNISTSHSHARCNLCKVLAITFFLSLFEF